jgi:hypothetical protein
MGDPGWCRCSARGERCERPPGGRGRAGRGAEMDAEAERAARRRAAATADCARIQAPAALQGAATLARDSQIVVTTRELAGRAGRGDLQGKLP